MTVPLYARSVAAIIGGVLVLIACSNVIGTLIVPRPLGSGLGDSAALLLALSPGSAPVVPARLCLRSGFFCFRQIALALSFEVPAEPDPGGQVSLSYQEFLDAVERLRAVNFPIERDPADAWPDFVGWRATYEQAAYAIAAEVDAVPALWSGPRRLGDPPIPPTRPPAGHPLRAPDPKVTHRGPAHKGTPCPHRVSGTHVRARRDPI
jgi:hypothetical protein